MFLGSLFRSRDVVISALLIPLLALPTVTQSAPNLPETLPTIDFGAKLKLSLLDEEDRSLGQKSLDNTSAIALVLQPELFVKFSESWSAYAYAELFAADDIIELDEDYASSQSDGYASIREFWIDYQGFARYPGESLRLGLERLREPTALWWDREAFLARWRMDTSLMRATVGVAERGDFLRSDDAELGLTDENRLRVFAGLDYQWRLHHWLGFKLMHSSDRVEDTALAQALPLFRREYTWFGLGANNEAEPHSEPQSWQYSFETMALTGTAERSVSQNQHVDVQVDGWAVDMGLRKRFEFAAPIQIGLRLALGSGGNGLRQDHSFYQTGLNTNRSRFAGTRTLFSRFGESAKAELSNLQVVTGYITQNIGTQFEWSLVGHTFSRVDAAQAIILRGISVSAINGQKSIGSEVDLFLGFNSDRKSGLLAQFSARLRVGYFDAGDAYSIYTNEGKYRAVLDFQKGF